MEQEKFYYDNKIVKLFAYATMFWGIVAMLVGLLAAIQISFPIINFGLPFTTFGRVRPVHTNAVIFAFAGNAIFTGAYYSVQRLLKTRMFSDILSKINFWGWQLIILSAAVTLLLGYTVGKEYAELEWPIDIMIAIIWVSFGWNLIGTMIRRRVQHIYVAIWFFLASFIAVAILHIGNSIEIPVSFLKSYSVYAGVQDALVQWWYGHNAVAFFLTTPFLGLMYYFLPKAAERPIYSYRLSIVHFWALIFIYMWAGPHHLLYQSLPDWAQTLGVVFSVMLIAPSWGGMINGLLTLRGAWDKVRDSAVLKFFVVAVTAYGMVTFEGPILSIKSVNALSHFTDWTIAHVHIGGMGWNGFIIFGMMYWLIPRLFRTKLHSEKWANAHFWIATLGMLAYSVPLYWAGFTQTLMWRQFAENGFLAHTDFLETVTAIRPMYHTRILGGALYFSGAVLFLINMIKTVKSGSMVENEETSAPALEKLPKERMISETPHRWVERKAIRFSIFVLAAIFVGGAVEVIPMIAVKSNIPHIASVKPYSPLELQGRDIYVREGCYLCHSQMVRPFRHETERYGEYSKEGEFVYDHPFQWGSKRTGPDLARAGVVAGKMYRTAIWHYQHMLNPQNMFPQSLMPRYPWLIDNDLDNSTLERKITVMKELGVPYPENYEKQALSDLEKQAQTIADELKTNGVTVSPKKEIIALIAYLHKLGRDISVNTVSDTLKTDVAADFSASKSADDLKDGKEIYIKTCAVCHGAFGEGNAVGPNLTDDYWLHGGTDKAIFATINNGISPIMPAFGKQMDIKQIGSLASYIISLKGTNPKNAKAPQGKKIGN
jgi:cytochrome c oxidase cbb3-type subunit I/II